MIPKARSVLLALGVPVVLVTVGVLVLGGSTVTMLGVPIIFMFMFAMFPITSLLMWMSWRLYDRHNDYQLDEFDVLAQEVIK